jgi:hypothetical protein
MDTFIVVGTEEFYFLFNFYSIFIKQKIKSLQVNQLIKQLVAKIEIFQAQPKPNNRPTNEKGSE